MNARDALELVEKDMKLKDEQICRLETMLSEAAQSRVVAMRDQAVNISRLRDAEELARDKESENRSHPLARTSAQAHACAHIRACDNRGREQGPQNSTG